MDFGYDDCVRLARDNAVKNGWILVQDTAWDGYEEIPLHIMEGYLTMGLESIQASDLTVISDKSDVAVCHDFRWHRQLAGEFGETCLPAFRLP